MDTYSTQDYQEVVANLKRPQNGLMAAFFPREVTFDTEAVTFDEDLGRRFLAPFVHPDVPAAVRGQKGRKTTTFNPAYIKELTPVRPGMALKRAVGETFATPLTPEQRRAALEAGIVSDQVDNINRRLEAMCAEALFTGKIVVTGTDYATQTVDFQRVAALQKAANTLTGTAKWGASAANPLKDVRTWSRKIIKESGSGVTNVVMDVDAADAWLDDPTIQKKLDTRNMDIGAVQVNQAQAEGLQRLGVIQGVTYWQYVGYYTDANGTEQEFYSGGNVALIGDVAGVQNFGAIQDFKALKALSIFTKSWEQENPSVQYILSQSAPLPTPRRINASLIAQVL